MSKSRRRRILLRDAPSVAVSAVRPAAAGVLRGRRLLAGRRHPEALRNGADAWVRLALSALGLPFFWLPPMILVLVMAAWNLWRQADKPGDLVGVLTGMALESVAFASAYGGLAKDWCRLCTNSVCKWRFPARPEPRAVRLSPISAPAYTRKRYSADVVFGHGLAVASHGAPKMVAMALAATASATLFSAAHHLGPYGQPYDNYLFLFRMAAGVYFAMLYQSRGFGVAVGAHACYNLMVSVGVA